ncbi:unnamed protein product [Parnassius apollo]|uniref:(apollo) hypothetical protein n=1 Tax=Parnassius apollo TaxID=110799 RepID=A0A8S3W930_PARAO|nr:unnamed protein product [Parnassius apollo]
MSELNNLKYEDTVQCFFFSSHENVNWEQLYVVINEKVAALSEDYIWHKDEFKIRQPLLKNDSDLPLHLTSTTCFEDNIEDEWFIAYLVLKLTEEYNDLIVKIEDNDGDFLLIEAADYLPSWANPETTQNRVFIYNNHIHLIPPSVAELKTPLKLNDALKLIIEHPEETKAGLQIEQAILERIGAYPNRIKELKHKATVNIPIDLAALLIIKPTLISSLVNMYRSHDYIDAKIFRKVKFDNCVNVNVQFTKFQYAVLLNSKHIANFRNAKISFSDKKNVIGYKLACGYEMIMSESRKDKFSSTEYKKFLNNLTKNGYFKGNIEGSKDYKQLLDKANTYFMETECPASSYISSNISHILSSKEFVQIKEALTQNPNLYLHGEDSDEWLNVDPSTLDDLLNKNYRKQVNSDDLITPSIITTGLSNFLSQKSDFEGIEENDACIQNDKIEFDCNQFFTCVESMLNMVKLDAEYDELSDSSDNEISDSFVDTGHQLDKELEAEMVSSEQHIHLKSDKSILENFVHSMKEEGLSGPSSNILRSVGINKTDLLDSDDDEE